MSLLPIWHVRRFLVLVVEVSVLGFQRFGFVLFAMLMVYGNSWCTFTKPQPPAWESSFYPSWQNGESTEALGSWHYEIFRSFQVILFEERNSLLFYVSHNNLPLSSWRCPAHFWASEFSSWNGRVKVFLNRDLCGRVNKMMLKRCRDKSFTES